MAFDRNALDSALVDLAAASEEMAPANFVDPMETLGGEA